jgi:Family of unknown function (DUF5455)
MPKLATLLVELFSGLVSFLIQFVSKKVAFGLSVVVVLGSITAVLITALRAVFASLATSIGDSDFVMGFAMAVPDNAPACITAYVTTWSACTLYSWQKKALQLFATVS